MSGLIRGDPQGNKLLPLEFLTVRHGSWSMSVSGQSPSRGKGSFLFPRSQAHSPVLTNARLPQAHQRESGGPWQNSTRLSLSTEVSPETQAWTKETEKNSLFSALANKIILDGGRVKTTRMDRWCPWHPRDNPWPLPQGSHPVRLLELTDPRLYPGYTQDCDTVQKGLGQAPWWASRVSTGLWSYLHHLVLQPAMWTWANCSTSAWLDFLIRERGLLGSLNEHTECSVQKMLSQCSCFTCIKYRITNLRGLKDALLKIRIDIGGSLYVPSPVQGTAGADERQTMGSKGGRRIRQWLPQTHIWKNTSIWNNEDFINQPRKAFPLPSLYAGQVELTYQGLSVNSQSEAASLSVLFADVSHTSNPIVMQNLHMFISWIPALCKTNASLPPPLPLREWSRSLIILNQKKNLID